ncbi:MAG: S41 family peptidase, partial [Candidatus Tectomicrobia bacterium]|nr:S41 family peptidase [Candidatus Tectomicrobia bacterium]
VLLDRYADLPIVRILSFTAGTPEELQNLFATLDQTTPAVLDLRGNPGGSLYDAIDAAMLFLNNGQKVVTLRTREGSRIYRRNLPAAPFTAPLYLWQDAYTASAAEVFIAALQQNQRAVSIGRKTFGKSTVQKLIALSDGSALYLTTSDVQTPNGNLYHQHGLDPTYRLDKPRVETEDYLAKVKVLMRTRK